MASCQQCRCISAEGHKYSRVSLQANMSKYLLQQEQITSCTRLVNEKQPLPTKWMVHSFDNLIEYFVLVFVHLVCKRRGPLKVLTRSRRYFLCDKTSTDSAESRATSTDTSMYVLSSGRPYMSNVFPLESRYSASRFKDLYSTIRKQILLSHSMSFYELLLSLMVLKQSSDKSVRKPIS